MKKKNKTFLVIFWNVGIIILISIAYFNFKQVGIPEMQEAIIKETVILNDAAYNRAMKRIELELDNWEPNIDNTIEDLASLKGSAVLTYLIAKDKIYGTSSAQDRIDSVIFQHIGREAINLNKSVEKILEELREGLNQNKSNMLKTITAKSAQDFDMTFEQLQNRINEVSPQFGVIAVNTIVSSVILVSSVLGSKMILSQSKRVLSAVIKRLVVVNVASGTAIISDGPLPFGDMVAVVIEIGGTGWAAYDLYKAQIVLKEKVRQELIRGKDNYRIQIFNICSQIAAKLVNKQNKNNMALLYKLNKL